MTLETLLKFKKKYESEGNTLQLEKIERNLKAYGYTEKVEEAPEEVSEEKEEKPKKKGKK